MMRRAMMQLALMATMLWLMAGTSRAGVVIDINQVGSDVVATGSGSLDLTGLTFDLNESNTASGVQPNIAEVAEGLRTGNSEGIYLGATGPTSFGSGGGAITSSGSGDSFGVIGNGGGILVPVGYVSGTALSATDTFSGQTFSSLGLTPGTYTYTWGTGGPNHTLEVQIGPAGPTTPEPSTLIGGALAVAVALGCAWRRRRPSVVA